MDFKQKLEKLVKLAEKISKLNMKEFCSIRYGDDKNPVNVFMFGGAKVLPEGDIKYRIFEKERVCNYPWEAFVVINGVEYSSLVSQDEAWALYV